MQGQTNVVIALTANPLDGLDLVQGQKHGPMRNQPSAPRRCLLAATSVGHLEERRDWAESEIAALRVAVMGE